MSLTRTLAVEVARDNIPVSSLCPGWVDTPFNGPVVSFTGGRVARNAMVAQEVRLGRQGQPSEMAEALASSRPLPRRTSPARLSSTAAA